jgi:hypothetical protein
LNRGNILCYEVLSADPHCNTMQMGLPQCDIEGDLSPLLQTAST